jgi:hypothetical protein
MFSEIGIFKYNLNELKALRVKIELNIHASVVKGSKSGSM